MVDPDESSAFARAVAYALRAERLRRGWRLAEIGRQVELSPSQLSRLENGIRPLGMGRLVRLCAVLGVAPASVIETAQDEAFPLGHPWDRS
jgi:transcriptional regulator with XRE-family HTH domain